MSVPLLVLILAAHLLCMNLAAAGPLVVLWLGYRGRRGDELARTAGKQLAVAAIAALTAGGLLGLTAGWLLWDSHYATQVNRLWPKISTAIMELAFSLFLMIVYVIWRQQRETLGRGMAFLRGFLLFLASTNLLYHFPFLFAILSEADSGRIPGDALITASAFRQLVIRGDIFSRTVHFWLASLAVTGGFLLFLAWRRSESSPDDARRLTVWGGRLALVPTFFQMGVGIWVLVQLPRPIQSRLLGGDALAVCLLVTSVLLSVGLLHLLANAASGAATRRSLQGTVGVLVLIVILMTGTLQRTKTRHHRETRSEIRAVDDHRASLVSASASQASGS